jgi:hypothetical protein
LPHAAVAGDTAAAGFLVKTNKVLFLTFTLHSPVP